jgi:hypothetical protein
MTSGSLRSPQLDPRCKSAACGAMFAHRAICNLQYILSLLQRIFRKFLSLTDYKE